MYKIAKSIATIPTTTAAAERIFSGLRRIKTYCRTTQGQEWITALALLSIDTALFADNKFDWHFMMRSYRSYFRRTGRQTLFLNEVLQHEDSPTYINYFISISYLQEFVIFQLHHFMSIVWVDNFIECVIGCIMVDTSYSH